MKIYIIHVKPFCYARDKKASPYVIFSVKTSGAFSAHALRKRLKRHHSRLYADCGYVTASCPSVCPSVTLRYDDHTGWNISKIIASLISVGSVCGLD